MKLGQLKLLTPTLLSSSVLWVEFYLARNVFWLSRQDPRWTFCLVAFYILLRAPRSNQKQPGHQQVAAYH